MFASDHSEEIAAEVLYGGDMGVCMGWIGVWVHRRSVTPHCVSAYCTVKCSTAVKSSAYCIVHIVNIELYRALYTNLDPPVSRTRPLYIPWLGTAHHACHFAYPCNTLSRRRQQRDLSIVVLLRQQHLASVHVRAVSFPTRSCMRRYQASCSYFPRGSTLAADGMFRLSGYGAGLA